MRSFDHTYTLTFWPVEAETLGCSSSASSVKVAVFCPSAAVVAAAFCPSVVAAAVWPSVAVDAAAAFCPSVVVAAAAAFWSSDCLSLIGSAGSSLAQGSAF